MIRHRSTAWLSLPLLFAACFSARPAAVVHWFDPALPVGERAPGVRVATCAAAPQLRDEMLWRTGAFEFAYDEQHRWLASPAELIVAAVGDAPWSAGDGVTLQVTAFHGDLTAAPCAVLVVEARLGTRRETFAIRAPIAQADAESLAAGIAQALSQLRGELAQWAAQ